MTFEIAWQTSFPAAAPLLSWRADGTTLVEPYASHWTAYKRGWPDTARQRGYPVGGSYDPATTVSVSNHAMRIRLRRDGGSFDPGNSVHSCAMLPTAAQGVTYGRFTEVFQVPEPARGFKSAHLLWPHDGGQDSTGFEVDFPENEWDTTISAFVHSGGNPQQSFSTGARWNDRHTSVIEWTPGQLSFWLDGKLMGATVNGVPDIPMDWVIQNESALNGEEAAPGSSATIEISYVSYERFVA